MNIENIFNLYSAKVAQIQLYQRAVDKMTQKELKELNNFNKDLEKNPGLINLSSTLDNMYFKNAEDGKTLLFAHKKSSVADRIEAVVLHKNKQYQWLLAEAYESFEDFIKRVYAFAGYFDKNLWPLSDFGNISLSKLEGKEFEWFFEQAKKKQDTPQSILNIFRNKFQKLSILEIDNKLERNLKFIIIFIENLRHIIVHNSGSVTNKEKFKEKILKKSGLYNNGNPKEEFVKYIESYFGTNEYENVISLLEVRVKPEIPLIKIHIDRFDILTGYLMSYANIIFQCLKEYKVLN